MRKFGWDLPPGCTHADIDRHFGAGEMSHEAEEVYVLLEDAGVEQSIIDKVCETIDLLAAKECPVCLQKEIEAEIADQERFLKAMEDTHGMGY